MTGRCNDCETSGTFFNTVEFYEEYGCRLCDRCRERREVERAEDNTEAVHSG